jgi:hypothetical protein
VKLLRRFFFPHITMQFTNHLWTVGLFTAISSYAAPTERNNGGKNKASTTYSECQRPKPQGQQLNSCPNGTVYVSQTDPQSSYGSVRIVNIDIEDRQLLTYSSRFKTPFSVFQTMSG